MTELILEELEKHPTGLDARKLWTKMRHPCDFGLLTQCLDHLVAEDQVAQASIPKKEPLYVLPRHQEAALAFLQDSR